MQCQPLFTRQELILINVKELIECSSRSVHIRSLRKHCALHFMIAFPSFLLAGLQNSQQKVCFTFTRRGGVITLEQQQQTLHPLQAIISSLVSSALRKRLLGWILVSWQAQQQLHIRLCILSITQLTTGSDQKISFLQSTTFVTNKLTLALGIFDGSIQRGIAAVIVFSSCVQSVQSSCRAILKVAQLMCILRLLFILLFSTLESVISTVRQEVQVRERAVLLFSLH